MRRPRPLSSFNMLAEKPKRLLTNSAYPYPKDPDIRKEASESDKKKTERLDLAILIETIGESIVPCSFCVENRRKYILYSEKSSRYSECVRSKKPVGSCNAELTLERTWESEVPRSSAWTSINR